MLVVQASISQSSMILLLTSSQPFIYVRNNDASVVDEGAWDIIRNEVIRLSISVNVSDATGRCCTGFPFSAECCCSCGESCLRL